MIPALQPLVYTLLHSLWEGAAAALLCAGMLRMIPARWTRVRYGVCLFSMAAMLMGSIATWAVIDSGPPGRVAGPVSTERFSNTGPGLGFLPAPAGRLDVESAGGNAQPGTQEGRGWMGWVAGLWSCGVVFFLVRMARDLLGANRLRREGEPVANPKLLAMAEELLRELVSPGRVGRIRLLVSSRLNVPAVIGFLRPAVLLPASMLTGMPEEYLRAVLAHEFAHIARWDYLVNIGQMVVEALFFFNPMVWWISRHIRREREACCDEIAAKCCEDRALYLEALLACADTAAGDEPLCAAALAATGRERSLEERAKRLLQFRYRPAIRIQFRTFIAILGISGVGLACMLEAAHATADILTPKERIDKIAQLKNEYEPEKSEATSEDQIMIRGQVVDENGRPIPKSEIRKLIYHLTISDGNGRADMEGDADFVSGDQSYMGTSAPLGSIVSIGAWVKGCAPVFFGPVVADKSLADVRIVVPKGFKATMHVHSEDGRPVEGAHITGYWNGPPQIGEIDAVTDAGGEATIGLSGTNSVNLTVAVKGFATARLGGARFDPTTPLDCVLKKSQPVHGRVIDAETGKPVPAAVIKLAGIQGPYTKFYDPGSAPRLATADVDGAFTLDTLSDDSEYHFFVEAGDRRTIATRGAGSMDQPMEIKLGPPVVAAGKVILSGTGPERIRISCTQMLEVGSGNLRGETSQVIATMDHGAARFRFPGLYTGDTWIRLEWGGKDMTGNYKDFFVPGIPGPRAFNLETLPAKGPPEDLVLELDPSQPKRKVVVRFDLPRTSPPPTGTIIANYTDDDGSRRDHTIKIDAPEVTLETPVPNTIDIRSTGLAGYYFKPRTGIPISAGKEPATIDLQVSPAGAIYGAWSQPDGFAPTESSSVEINQTDNLTGDDHVAGTVDSIPLGSGSGGARFIATPLPFGRDYVILVHLNQTWVATGPLHIDEKNPVPNLKITIPEGVTVRRHVIDSDGNPVAGFRFQFFYKTPWNTWYWVPSPPTDENGLLVIPHVNPKCPGGYQLREDDDAKYKPAQLDLDPAKPDEEIRLARKVG